MMNSVTRGTPVIPLATLGSGGSSSLESKQEAEPERRDDASAQSNTTVKDGKKESKSRSRSPRKPSLKRTGSKSKGYENTRRKDCECPECLARKAEGVSLPRIDTTRSEHGAAKPRQREPLPPLSPQLKRPSEGYPAPEAAAFQAARAPPPARPRVPASQSYRQARPMSFHAGVMPDMSYLQQPAFGGYAAASPFPPLSYTASQPPYYPPVQPISPPQNYVAPITPMTSPYDVQPRPRPVTTTRPQTVYYDMSPTYMEYAQPPYLPHGGPMQDRERRSRRQQPLQLRQELAEADDARRMPPPPPPPTIPRKNSAKLSQEQRPSIRHAATTSAAYPVSNPRSSARGLDEEQYRSHPSSRKQSFESPQRSRRPSIARPPRTSDDRVAEALQLDREMSRMNIIERNPASHPSKRRVSVYGHESLKDLEGSVEAYQASRSGRESTSIPAGDDMLRLIRKKTLPAANSSDGGSRLSGDSRASRDGSDVKSSRRLSNDLKRRDSNDEAFAMRIPKGANLNLQPGFEGRTISLRQSRDGDGDMELKIGERGRAGITGAVGSRPALREKSTRRYSIVDGQALIESEGASRPEPRKSISRRDSLSRRPEDPRLVEREMGDDGHRRVVREKIITRTIDRSRYSSRGRYGARDENMF